MKSFNAYLNNLQNKVFDAHRQLNEKDDTFTAQRLRDQSQGKIEKQCTLIEVFKTIITKWKHWRVLSSLKVQQSVKELL